MGDELVKFVQKNPHKHKVVSTNIIYIFQGKLASKDRVIVISHSGNTDEIINVIEHIKVKNVPVIAVLGNSGEH